MAIEIERKFLLANDAWRAQVLTSTRLCQGYLGGERASIRVRMADDAAWLTIKERRDGIERLEFEYPIPRADAEAMLDRLSGSLIRKTRHIVAVDGFRFEIDEFDDANAGLIVAELELNTAEQSFPRPAWLGAEVSDDPRYFNAALARHPYGEWGNR
jgi:adenylate cyclase